MVSMFDDEIPRLPGTLGPYFHGRARPVTNADEAFIRVSVVNELKPSGYVSVYLANGTQLNVQGRDLLRFKTCE